MHGNENLEHPQIIQLYAVEQVKFIFLGHITDQKGVKNWR